MERLEKTFGERVSDLLDTYQRRGKTAQDLADSFGVSRRTIYNYRDRVDPPNSDEARKTRELLPQRERYEYREVPRRRYEKRQEEGFPDEPSVADFVPREEGFISSALNWIRDEREGQAQDFAAYMESGGRFVVDIVVQRNLAGGLVFNFREYAQPGLEIVDEVTFTYEGYSDLDVFLNDFWLDYMELYGRN